MRIMYTKLRPVPIRRGFRCAQMGLTRHRCLVASLSVRVAHINASISGLTTAPPDEFRVARSFGNSEEILISHFYLLAFPKKRSLD